MRKILIFCVTFIIIVTGHAKQVSCTIVDGIDNGAIKSKIETAVCQILNEINAAYVSERSPNLTMMGINSNVQQSVAMLWENSPFVCAKEEIIEHCITTTTGYQIRNISLKMKLAKEQKLSNDEYQEAVISFDKQGNMESFKISIPMSLYVHVINSSLAQTDISNRQIMLDYVEQFLTACYQKDISFLYQVFFSNAFTPKAPHITPPKTQYKKLCGIFQHGDCIQTSIDNIEVRRHPFHPELYGVTLLCRWESGKYHDGCYLFQLWDFTNEKAPQIHVQIWQPDKIGGKPLPKEFMFSLSDLDI